MDTLARAVGSDERERDVIDQSSWERGVRVRVKGGGRGERGGVGVASLAIVQCTARPSTH